MPLADLALEANIAQLDLIYFEILVLEFLGGLGSFRATCSSNRKASLSRSRRCFLALVDLSERCPIVSGGAWLEREELEILAETPDSHSEGSLESEILEEDPKALVTDSPAPSYIDEQEYWNEIWSPSYDNRDLSPPSWYDPSGFGSGSD